MVQEHVPLWKGPCKIAEAKAGDVVGVVRSAVDFPGRLSIVGFLSRIEDFLVSPDLFPIDALFQYLGMYKAEKNRYDISFIWIVCRHTFGLWCGRVVWSDKKQRP